MRLETLGLVGLLATSCAADNLAVWTSYDHKTGPSIGPPFGIFYTGYDSYQVTPLDTCGLEWAVPGMVEFCMDWDNARGHFRYKDQTKRCLSRQYVRTEILSDGVRDSNLQIWEEVACTW